MAFHEDKSGTVQVGALRGSTRRDLYSFSIPMMVLTTLAIALRVYVRGYMTKTFGVEDWLIIPAYVLFMVLCISTIVIGEWLVHDDIMERYPQIIKITIANSILFTADQILIKLSVAAFLSRICERWQRYVIFGTVTIFCLYQIAYIFVGTFQCGVPTVSNLVRAVRTSTPGQCISWVHVVKPLLYVSVALNAACDSIFVLACLPVLTKLRRMPIGEVCCIYFLIFLATGASVISLVRLRYVPGDDMGVVLLNQNKEFAILTFVETGTAIIAVCLATLHPLVQACVRKRRGSRYHTPSSRREPESADSVQREKRKAEPTSTEEMSTDYQKNKCKTYSSRDSHVVTHRSTNLPFNCLCMAERTGCPVFS
ncbi:hypothetical protein KCU78_g15186, partial [Aureobasidium melanogenum]